MEQRQVTKENFWPTLNFILSGEIIDCDSETVYSGDLYEGITINSNALPTRQRLHTTNGQIEIWLNRGLIEINGTLFNADAKIAYRIATKVYEKWHGPIKQEKKPQKKPLENFFGHLVGHLFGHHI